MNCWSRKRNIFPSPVCVVQMVFLKVYFCACTVFLNNVPMSTGKDKPRGARNLLGHKRSVAAWAPPWVPSVTGRVSVGGSEELAR